MVKVRKTKPKAHIEKDLSSNETLGNVLATKSKKIDQLEEQLEQVMKQNAILSTRIQNLERARF